MRRSRPLLLDLFCGAGGAAMGYHRAGFEVVGVDNRPQPNYPFEFIQADAMEFPLDGYDAIHASPPCQTYTAARRISQEVEVHSGWLRGRKPPPRETKTHPDLVGPVRERLRGCGKPWVIENVMGAPLEDPVLLCGTMFGLRHEGFELRRHRLFETSFHIPTDTQQIPRPLGKCLHRGPAAPVFGHSPGRNFYLRHGRGFGLADRRALMGIPARVYVEAGGMEQGWSGTGDGWSGMSNTYSSRPSRPPIWAEIAWVMSQSELSEAIPPVYTEEIGSFLLKTVLDGGWKSGFAPKTTYFPLSALV